MTPIEVLLVEDNPGDAELVTEFLAETTPCHITVATDGLDAMAKLEGLTPQPELVLLDLNLPRKDGRSVLADMREREALRAIPVIVFSSSESPLDVDSAYELGANCYVTKPMQLDEFERSIRDIASFWFARVRLPGRTAPRTPAPG